MFKKRENVAEIEEGKLLSPKFDNDGLIPVVTTCANTKEILMHGFMNVEALKLKAIFKLVTIFMLILIQNLKIIIHYKIGGLFRIKKITFFNLQHKIS